MAFSFRAGTNWCHDFPKLARESGFCFNVHRTRVRVDWNRISECKEGSIDIDRVIRERDFLTVDDNVNNVVDYSLESEYDVKILDPNFVKLFRLAQLSVEYLLYCKQYLDHSVIILKDELRFKIEDNLTLKREVESLRDTIKELNQRMKERNRIIESKLGDSNGELFKCPYCTKTFIAPTYLSAHIARRHPHLSDPYTMPASSPMHEQYRVETEKLHNEIKTLKERLNQTERVIRSESDKAVNCARTDISYRALDTSEKGEYTSEKEREEKLQEQQRKYQDEIASLKSMLLAEIKNLKQKDVSVSSIYQIENDTNTMNFKELIKKQEKEINTLRDQLREKLTPDLKNVQEKLQLQEQHWKVINERLEKQHNLDSENLSTQLKLSQEAAKEMKELYESKINELEMNSVSQKKMLEAQGIHLKQLSRELFESREISQRNARERIIDSRNESPNRSTINKGQSIRDVEYSSKVNLKNNKQSELVHEEVGDVSSHESPKILASSKQKSTKCISRREIRADLFAGSGDFESSEDTEIVRTVDERMTPVISPKNLQVKKDLNVRNSKKTLVENLNLESVSSGHSEKIIPQSLEKNKYQGTFQASSIRMENRIQKSKKNSPYMSSPNLKASKTVDESKNIHESSKNNVRNVRSDQSLYSPKTKLEKKIAFEKFDSRISTREKSIEESEESEDYSDTESESSISNSDSEIVPDNEKREKYTSNSHDSESPNFRERKKEFMQENPIVIRELNLHLKEAFDKKLKDLGIDPEWIGIPDATFRQKMETVARHQHINSKKISGYNRIQQKILKKVSQTLLEKKGELRNSEKKSPLNRIMSKVKNKTANVFKHHKSSESRKPILKSQLVTPRDKSLRSTSNLEILPKRMKEADINEMRNKKSTESLQKMKPESQSSVQSISVKNSEASSQIKSRILDRKRNAEIVNHNKVVEELEDSSSFEELSESQNGTEYISENNSARNASKLILNTKSTKVTSTPNKSVDDIMEQSYSSADDESDDNLITEERARSLPASPKNNKSVLKSTTGSVGSLVKKKVLFDLERSLENNSNKSPEKTAGENWSAKKLFPEYDFTNEEVNDDNWNISNVSDDSASPEKKMSQSVENIVLKTSQSDRIAKISQKIQDQLSIVRQKPVGAVEAMFLAKPGGKVNEKDSTQYRSSTSIASSILESPENKFLAKESVKTDNRFPKPAQRTSNIHESDIESDIEELLQME